MTGSVLAVGLSVIAVGALSLTWRLLPLWFAPHAGCDAYYFLLRREQFLQDRRVPIVMPPLYVLENREHLVNGQLR